MQTITSVCGNKIILEIWLNSLTVFALWYRIILDKWEYLSRNEKGMNVLLMDRNETTKNSKYKIIEILKEVKP